MNPLGKKKNALYQVSGDSSSSSSSSGESESSSSYEEVEVAANEASSSSSEEDAYGWSEGDSTSTNSSPGSPDSPPNDADKAILQALDSSSSEEDESESYESSSSDDSTVVTIEEENPKKKGPQTVVKGTFDDAPKSPVNKKRPKEKDNKGASKEAEKVSKDDKSSKKAAAVSKKDKKDDKDKSKKDDMKTPKKQKDKKDDKKKSSKKNKKDEKKSSKKEKKISKKEEKKSKEKKSAEDSEVGNVSTPVPVIQLSDTESSPEEIDELVAEKKGLFGSGRRSNSRDSVSEEEIVFEGRQEEEVFDEDNPEKKGRFGSIFRRKSRDDQDGDEAPTEGETPDTEMAKKENRGLFGRRRKSRDDDDDDAPQLVADYDDDDDGDEPTKKKRGRFGSLRRRLSRDSMDYPDFAGDESDEESLDMDADGRVKADKKKTGFIGSLRRRLSRDSMDVDEHEHRDRAVEAGDEIDVAPDGGAPKEKKGVFGSIRRRKSPDNVDEENPAMDADDEMSDTDEPSKEKKGMFSAFWFGNKSSDPTDNDPMEDGKRDRSVPIAGASDGEHLRKDAVTCRKLSMALILATVVIVLTNIGTSYFGSKLALETFDFTPAGNATGPCAFEDVNATENATGPCAFEDVELEFNIKFDNNPDETGVVLRDTGPIRSTLWNFDVGAFRSFSQFQRENKFSVCLSPSLPYEFEMIDSVGDGLVGLFVDTVIYGSWELMYNGELVANYNGDCNATGVSECGAYCFCSYNLTASGSEGSCLTNCTGITP